MSLIKVTKAISIDNKVLDKIEDVGFLMGSLAKKLEEIAQEDDFYTNLYKHARIANAHIETFLDAYAERNQ